MNKETARLYTMVYGNISSGYTSIFDGNPQCASMHLDAAKQFLCKLEGEVPGAKDIRAILTSLRTLENNVKTMESEE